MDEWIVLLREIDAKVNDLWRRLDNADAEIRADLHVIKADVKRLHEMSPNYVTTKEYLPVQKVVYGLVALVLSGVGLALIALVVR